MIRIEIIFLTSKQGGRIGPVTSGYRPNFVFNSKKELSAYKTGDKYSLIDCLDEGCFNMDGALVLKEGNWVSPGEKINCELKLFSKNENNGKLKKGASFYAREGARIIATGEIIELKLP